MAKQLHVVSLSESAFFTMVAAALEAYEISHGNNQASPHVPVETYGNLWGYETYSKRGERILHVSMADVETSADRGQGSVQPKDESFELKQGLIGRFKPELEYLGDFHSHPYDFDNDKIKTALEVERGEYYRFSPGDIKHARMLKETRDYRVGIVTTVFRGTKHVHRNDEYVCVEKENFSCIRFSYGEFIIWIKAHVFADKNAVNDQKLVLLCPSVGFDAGVLNLLQED
jgi:hypothetical protein